MNKVFQYITVLCVLTHLALSAYGDDPEFYSLLGSNTSIISKHLAFDKNNKLWISNLDSVILQYSIDTNEDSITSTGTYIYPTIPTTGDYIHLFEFFPNTDIFNSNW